MVAHDKRDSVARKFHSFLQRRMGEKAPARVEIISEEDAPVTLFAMHYNEPPAGNPGIGRLAWFPLVVALCPAHPESECIQDRSDPRKFDGVLGVSLDQLEPYLNRQLAAEVPRPLR